MNEKINAIYLQDKQKVIKRLRFPGLLTHHQLINSSTHQLILSTTRNPILLPLPFQYLLKQST